MCTEKYLIDCNCRKTTKGVVYTQNFFMELTNKTHSKPDLTYNMNENYKIDFISCLYDRNMINIIGKILCIFVYFRICENK